MSDFLFICFSFFLVFPISFCFIHVIKADNFFCWIYLVLWGRTGCSRLFIGVTLINNNHDRRDDDNDDDEIN